ncbi:hypothetical protein HAX54_006582 [Datura stramonium]|uniref:Uncharacterized protein n=1 Tax=Datura stramonium TaxID=4076 RepID=A0ABS8TAG8_DATST|nr:hypothetical protein [Datura stramonium]
MNYKVTKHCSISQAFLLRRNKALMDNREAELEHSLEGVATLTLNLTFRKNESEQKFQEIIIGSAYCILEDVYPQTTGQTLTTSRVFKALFVDEPVAALI